MNIEYDDRKCACCQKVHVNALLMDDKNAENKDKHYIICLSCAKDIHKYVAQMQLEG